MITFVDTNILLDVFLPDPKFGNSSAEYLEKAFKINVQQVTSLHLPLNAAKIISRMKPNPLLIIPITERRKTALRTDDFL